ncbi:hypothetical protein [Streptomyces sp. RFCAC02]|uniref:hypothetical protein n=1 Tax=Streptomyces sp. RFCAC02 TaxID=2499143 RepID=UPI00102142F3|nr:hypothetical protein [Streptomyces sp. RFCAC02]
MSKLGTRVAAVAAGLAMCAGVSVATAASASAAPRGFTYAGCITAGNILAQQGKLTGYTCVRQADGSYYLVVSRTGSIIWPAQ